MTTFQSLVPNLMVKNVSDSVRYYQDALGFSIFFLVSTNKETDMKIDEHKEYMFAILKKDEVEIMLQTQKSLAEDVPVFANKQIESSISLYCRMSDVDEFYNKVNTKVDIIRDIKTAWYGVREFFIRDIDGYILGFAQEMKK